MTLGEEPWVRGQEVGRRGVGGLRGGAHMVGGGEKRVMEFRG